VKTSLSHTLYDSYKEYTCNANEYCVMNGAKASSQALKEIEIGYQLSDKLSMGISLQNTGIEFNKTSFVPFQYSRYDTQGGIDYTLYPILTSYSKIYTQAIMANWQYKLVRIQNFTPYISFAAGLASHRPTDYKLTASYEADVQKIYTVKSSINRRATFNVGLGLETYLTSNVVLGIGAKYLHYGKGMLYTNSNYCGEQSCIKVKGTKITGFAFGASLTVQSMLNPFVPQQLLGAHENGNKYIKLGLDQTKKKSVQYDVQNQSEMNKETIESKPAINAEIGYILDDYFRFGISLRHLSQKREKYAIGSQLFTKMEDGTDEIDYTLKPLLTTEIPMVSSAALMNMHWNFLKILNTTAYISAGIGASYNKLHPYTITIAYQPDAPIKHNFSSQSSINTAYQTGMGIRTLLASNIELDVNITYFNYGQRLQDAQENIIFPPYKNTNSKNKLHGVDVGLGIIYRF
jgi:opacity protein-like surface antigen